MSDRGLDDDGTIAREGALDHVPAAFGPVVEAARARITGTLGRSRLHSAYLYGSIPRGTARPGRSDVDLLLARETNGDLGLVLPDWRAQARRAVADTDRLALSRVIARRLVHTGFTLVMPRWAAGPATSARPPSCSPATTPNAPGRCASPPRPARIAPPIPPFSPCSSTI